MSYDPQCAELARYFYPQADDEAIAELSQQIQDTVEAFGPALEDVKEVE